MQEAMGTFKLVSLGGKARWGVLGPKMYLMQSKKILDLHISYFDWKLSH